jgi:hypothetical protein
MQESSNLSPFTGLGNITSLGNQQISSISGMDLNGAAELRKLGLGDTLYSMAGLNPQDAYSLFGGNPFTGERLGYAEQFDGLAHSAPDNIGGVKQALNSVNGAMSQIFGNSGFNNNSAGSNLPPVPSAAATPPAAAKKSIDIKETLGSNSIDQNEAQRLVQKLNELNGTNLSLEELQKKAGIKSIDSENDLIQLQNAALA